MPPSTSVLLPTTTPSPVVEEVASQLAPSDELLVVCDDEDDPVTAQVAEFESARLVVAGDPSGCSGKANAIAAGMDAAAHDRFVWTDDDFHHPPNWLSGLHDSYAENGPVSELPYFEGRDVLSTLLEPVYALGGTLGVYTSGKAWAGAVMFERDDIDVDAFLHDLRRTISDDALLSEYLDVTPLKRVRRVRIGGTIRGTLERHVRFVQIVHRHDPRDTLTMGVITALVVLAAVLVPLYVAAGMALLVAAVNAYFDIYRWTALLAGPAFVLQTPLLGYALTRRTFVWGGRRYHWPSKFDVRIESEIDDSG